MIDDRHMGSREGGEGMSLREQQALIGEGRLPPGLSHSSDLDGSG